MLRHFLGGCFALTLLGCGSPSLLQCRVDAVSRLPLRVVEDPDALTVGDVKALVTELKACRVDVAVADGGVQ